MHAEEKNNNRRCLVRIAAVLAILLFACLVNYRQARAAGLLIADGGFGGRLEIAEHDVKVTINNGIAVTEVTQVFINTEKRQVEALYTFPVPKGASVANFSMWINGKEMVGEVIEKERARQIYNSYKRKRRDPGLLEQKDYKTFEMRIFPIGPEARQKVRVVYYQELDFDHDWATYVYPLATTTQQNIDSRVRGRFSIAVDIKSAIPIVALQSPSHGDAFLMTEHSEGYQEASLESRDGDLARDVVLAVQVSRPVTGIDQLTSKQADGDGYFALTLTAGKELEKTQTGSDYVFILDISGSMADDGKLQTSVHSIAAFIEALDAEDRFEVITFNRKPTTLFNQLATAAEENRNGAIAFLQSREALGGTILQPALAAAYKYASSDRPLNTVILSDGMTEQDERRVLVEMIGARPANVRVFCVGVGNEINRSLLRQLAEDAGGLAAFISQGDDFKRQARAFRRKLLHPVATNLRMNFSGIEAYDVEPEKLPNLYYGMPVRMYGRYKGAGTARVELTAEVNGRPVTTVAELDFPNENGANPEIERMWAWHRMEQLKRLHEINKGQNLLDEIIRLGETYSITSEYTSFLVLENDAEYRRWKIEQRNAARIERDRAAQAGLRRQLESLRNKALADIGPLEKPGPVADASAGSKNRPMTRAGARPFIQPQNQTGPARSVDLPSFGGGGGGAMDPFSALIGITLAGGVFFNRKKRR